MNFNINFQKAKRNFMTLTFDDVDENGNPFEHQILVGMPKKRIYGILLDLKKTLSEDPENYGKLMCPVFSNFDKITMDDFINMSHDLFENY